MALSDAFYELAKSIEDGLALIDSYAGPAKRGEQPYASMYGPEYLAGTVDPIVERAHKLMCDLRKLDLWRTPGREDDHERN